MSHPLLERLRRLGAKARRLTLVHAACWFVVAAVAGMAGVGFIDFLLRSDELPLRLLASLATLGAILWAYFRFLHPAVAQRLTDLQVASHVEQRFPQLKGLVANTIAFLGEPADDPLAGSYAMRRAVVSEAVAEMEEVDLGECLDRKAARRAMGAALVAILAVGAVFVLAPSSTTHAAARILMPWEKRPWPRRNALDLVDPPSRIARGGDLEVEIIDHNGRLPEEVSLEVQREDGNIQTRSAVFVGGKMLARVNNVAKSFRYRAVGGDDDTMAWRELEVVTPPELLELKIDLSPPKYSGWPQEQFAGDVRGLAGSVLAINGRVDQTLQSAAFMFEPNGSASSEPQTTELKIVDNAFQSAGEPFRLKTSGQFWVDFVDHRGVRSGKAEKWNLEVVQDNAPTVSFNATQFSRYVTADAIAPIRAIAEDDLALERVMIVYQRSGVENSPEEIVELWAGPKRAPPQESSRPTSDRREVSYDWTIAAIPGLNPGDSIEFQIAADDYAGQRGTSPNQRLTIVSRSELEDRLARDQGFILERIAEALRSQRESRKQVQALEIQWEQTKSFSKADVDQLQSAELNQRQVTRLLAGPQDGVLSLLRRLIENIENNRLNNPNLSRRVKQLTDGVTKVTQMLPEIQRPLLGGLKDLRPKLVDVAEDVRVETGPETAAKLESAKAGQDEAIATLEKLLGEMAQWENYRRFAREIGRLQREQDDLEQRTDDVRLQTLSRDWETLSPEQRATLLRLAQEQVGLAQRLDKLQSRMGKAGEQLENEDPLAADTLSEGAAAAQQMAISGQMREIARSLASNQVGQAKQRQEEVKDSLSELLNILGNRREDELDRKLRKLGDLEKTLAGLESREQAVADQLAEMGKNEKPDERELERLAREQEKLAAEAEQAARRLERLDAQQPSSATGDAAQAMRASGQAGQQANGQQAEQQAKSALEKLQQARQQLKQEVQQTKQDLFFERLARLEQNIRGLAQRQTSVDETIDELLLIQETRKLTRQQEATLKNLAEIQNDLSSEAADIGRQVSEAKVFSLALTAAAREMARAAQFLENSQLAEAGEASETALARLNQLIEALKPEPPAENPMPPQEQGPGKTPSPPPSGDAINQLAQLKLVKLLQQEILRRTEELEEIDSKQQLTPEQMIEYEDLSQEQGQLADILDDLIKSAEEAAAAEEAANENPANDPAEDLDSLLLEDLELDK